MCLEGATKGFFHEIHLRKALEKVPLDALAQEQLRTAGSSDLSILYCTSQVTVDLRMLPNVVGSGSWFLSNSQGCNVWLAFVVLPSIIA